MKIMSPVGMAGSSVDGTKLGKLSRNALILINQFRWPPGVI
jgi:hypothetical protein